MTLVDIQTGVYAQSACLVAQRPQGYESFF